MIAIILLRLDGRNKTRLYALLAVAIFGSALATTVSDGTRRSYVVLSSLFYSEGAKS